MSEKYKPCEPDWRYDMVEYNFYTEYDIVEWFSYDIHYGEVWYDVVK